MASATNEFIKKQVTEALTDIFNYYKEEKTRDVEILSLAFNTAIALGKSDIETRVIPSKGSVEMKDLADAIMLRNKWDLSGKENSVGAKMDAKKCLITIKKLIG